MLDRTLGPVRSRTASPDEVGDVTTGVAGACLAGLALSPDPEVAVALTRGVVATTRDADLLERWLATGRTDGGVDLDPSLRWSALARLATLGAVDAERIEAARVADGSYAGDLGAARALAARPTSAAKAEAWAAMTEPDVSNRLFESLAAGLWDASRPELCAPYVDAYLGGAGRRRPDGPGATVERRAGRPGLRGRRGSGQASASLTAWRRSVAGRPSSVSRSVVGTSSSPAAMPRSTSASTASIGAGTPAPARTCWSCSTGTSV